nr:NADH dehydrogenase subunit 4 [Secretargas transgariepinus]QLD97097.1 NADH dehydrogenase subunit 4 [Secretargas transgariepinus]
MLMISFLLFVILCLFYFISPLEIMMGLLIGLFLFVIEVDWCSLWFFYVGGLFGMDLMSIFLIMLSFWVILLMFLSSFSSMSINESSLSLYLLMMMFMLVICFSCVNLLGFFLFFEGVLFPIIMVIFNWGFQPERLQAGIYMLFYTLVGSLPLLVYLLMWKVSLNFIYLFWLGGTCSGFMFLMIVFAFFVKIPMFLCHLWLPKAHVEAPIVGSMILAGVLLKIGIFGLFRFRIFLGEGLWIYSQWIMSISLLGGIIISMICLCQVDLKSLIAYSSVCHMGLALGGFVSMNMWGGNGSVLLMLGHGLSSSGLFCLANMMYERFYTRSLILLKGVGLYFPFLSLWWFFFSIVNMSAPPSMNFVGELFLMGGMIKSSMFLFIPLGLMAFFSACYSLYMFSYTQHGSGWFINSVLSISIREYFLMFIHFIPLVFWVMKMDMFFVW